MKEFKNRIIRAAMLEPKLYEEVEADKNSLGQAALVVVLSSLAAGIGSITRLGVAGVALGTVIALVGWFVWAYLVYFIGTRILPEPQTKTDTGELLRTIGFSSSPGLARILAIIPGIGQFVFFCHGSLDAGGDGSRCPSGPGL